MKLLRSEIRSQCDNAVYQRGNDLYLKKKIIEMKDEREGSSVTLTGLVRGTAPEPYNCEVRFSLLADESLQIEDFECDCPAYLKWYGMCKHCACLCISFADRLKISQNTVRASDIPRRRSYDTDFELRDVLQRYSASHSDSMELAPGSLHISVGFTRSYSYYYASSALRIGVEIKAGTDRLYVVKSIPEFVHSVLHGTRYDYGKKLSVCHCPELFDDNSREILKILIQAVRENNPSIDNSDYFAVGSNERIITVNNVQAAQLMRLSMKTDGSVRINNIEHSCVDADPPISLSIHQTDGGAILSIPTIKRICTEPSAICKVGSTVYFCSELFQQKVLPFLYGVGAASNSESVQSVEKYLSEKDFSRFSAFVMPELRQVIKVDEGDVDFTLYLPKTPEFSFYLSETDIGCVSLRPEVSYGTASFPLEVVGKEYRNVKAEKSVVDAVSLFFPHVSGDGLRKAVTEDEIYNVLTSGLEKLRELGQVFVDDSLHSLRFASSPATNVGVALHGDLIDIEIESEGYSASEINDILDAYRLKKKYYRLKNGEFLSLTEGGLSVVAELSDGIDLHFDKNGKAQAPAFRASFINSVLDRDDALVDMRRNAAFKSQIMALKNYRDEDMEIPSSLNATLRGYQKSGYRWLCALSSCALGGILADDMGLGKTVQMLAYFLSAGKSFLVVCPASLIYNWDSECHRFAPSIPCHIMRGTEDERRHELEYSEGLTITSYDQLRRDIDLYKNREFDCCVLDEAQYIRNSETKAAKAVKLIRAHHRFALTGTPIENRLSDLWSIFDFLMPGYLFKKQDFKSRIEQAVVDGDEIAKERLTRLTSPFILRRKKADVLKELPDKQETVVYVEMSDKQRKLYNAQEQALRLTLQNSADAQFLHQKIEYLAALTRLRQICCTPELYLDNYEGGSGKTDACMELLVEGAESGHKTLVFSQFTGMLELLIERAEKLGLSWLYLSGKNTSEHRRDMVQKFQQGRYSVFFISLKAGGTGLNLTVADRVIHFDPWWNIAAEEQATDRTHRIGQKNKVFVTKLVCRNTVEERIIALQERKRALSDLVMDDRSVGSATLDRTALLQLLQNENI